MRDCQRQCGEKMEAGRQRTAVPCYVSNNDSERSHAVWKQLGCQKSHRSTDARSVSSPAGSTLAEVDFIWQALGDNGMAGLFLWEHICHLCGEQTCYWRGMTNEGCRTRGQINHANDDSEHELWQNVKMAHFCPFPVKQIWWPSFD